MINDYEIIPVGMANNLKGQKFGYLTVQGRIKNETKGTLWLCICKCGKQKPVEYKHLTSGNIRSCGCLKSETFRSRLKNKTFGRLTTIKDIGKNERRERVWLCSCECGNKIKVTSSKLNSGHTRSCGCLKGVSRRKNIRDKKFGRLTAIRDIGATKWKQRIYICKCDCGEYTKVNASDLISGHTRSCGCLLKEYASKRMKHRNKIVKFYGDKHHNFNLKLTNEERIKGRYKLFGANQSKWRDKVFKRDQYTCQN